MMKFIKQISVLPLCLLAMNGYAETKQTNITDSQYLPKKSVVTQQSDDLAKVGYGFGYMMGDGNKDSATDINLDAYFQGFRDAYLGNKPAFTEEEIKKY